MSRFIVFSFFLIFCLWCCQGTGTADIYKYVDKNGVTHFTNTPNNNDYRLLLKSSSRSIYSEQKFDKIIHKLCKKYDLGVPLIKAIIKAESGFNPLAVSKKGAQGLMQLMPFTARELNIVNPFDPQENLEGGISHLKTLYDKFNGDLPLVLAAYNAGENAVLRDNGVPPFAETHNYIKRVLKYKKYFQARPGGL
jgi:soluble lytic murein transglycosylase-like protein